MGWRGSQSVGTPEERDRTDPAVQDHVAAAMDAGEDFEGNFS